MAIGLAGAALLAWGGLSLGRNLTPLPRPPEGGTLIQGGAYRRVRHPIYSGACLAALGWALYHGRWAGLLGAAAQLLFFNAKANREEVWLTERFPEYPSYQREVAKLIPGL